MRGYNDDGVTKKITGFCNGAIIKMLITSAAFLLVCILIKANDFNYHINNLLIAICIIGSLFFPALSLLNIICTFLEIACNIIVHKSNAMDEIILILESKFGLAKEKTFGERFLCRLPLIGSKIQQRQREELEDVVKGILGKTFFSLLTMSICFIIFSSVIKPVLIKEAIGCSTISLFLQYIRKLIGCLWSSLSLYFL